jgi:hypothetical protein
MAVLETHWPAVLACAAAYLILGEIWYSPPAIALLWRRFVPDIRTKIRRDPASYLNSIVYAFVMMWLVSAAIVYVDAGRAIEGVEVGAIVFLVTKTISALTYARNRGTGTSLWWIHSAHQLSGFAILGAVLAVWR